MNKKIKEISDLPPIIDLQHNIASEVDIHLYQILSSIRILKKYLIESQKVYDDFQNNWDNFKKQQEEKN